MRFGVWRSNGDLLLSFLSLLLLLLTNFGSWNGYSALKIVRLWDLARRGVSCAWGWRDLSTIPCIHDLFFG